MATTPRSSKASDLHSDASNLQLLIDWLSKPAAYPERPASVERVETHISCVFLTDRFAYKLKKPVRFDFLDFSTAELRRQACEDEIRLNRRLAPDVYLGLIAVRRNSTGEFLFDEGDDSPPADAVDWLVKMHRLPDDATLLAKIRACSAGATDIVAIANRLAGFYRSAPPLAIQAAQYRADIERHVRANRAELLNGVHGQDVTRVKRVHASQLQLLLLRPELFDARVAASRIIDGHGDLRPEHIYVDVPNGPAIIDCIEFNAEFRHLDIADELSFLATECDFAGAEAIGREIFERTSVAIGDQPPSELVAFYRSYRACVRAKVAALRANQQSSEARAASLAEARRHLEWADRYDRRLPAPFLLVVCGLMGSGKSTLAAKLAERFGAEMLSTDSIRREVFGESQQPHDYGAGHYRREDRMHIYGEMFARARQLLNGGLPVILDGAFPYAELRSAALGLTHAEKTSGFIIHCRCSPEVAQRRIASRLAAGRSDSEARPDLYDEQVLEEEPGSPNMNAIEIDTVQPLEHQIECVIKALRT